MIEQEQKIEPIDLSLSESMKAHIDLLKCCEDELKKWINDNIGISEKQMGKPTQSQSKL